MLYDCKRIPYWIDRRLTDLAGPEYDAIISFGLSSEPENSYYGKSRVDLIADLVVIDQELVALADVARQAVSERPAREVLVPSALYYW